DYGIESKPLVSITTRSKTRAFQQQSAPAPTSSDLQQTVDLDPDEDHDSSKHQDQNVPRYSSNHFDIRHLKEEQDKDPAIQQKIKQLERYPKNQNYLYEDGIFYRMISRKDNGRNSKLIYL
ncbi:unnamed protein product, partial [Didymodactylos carnosus]